MTNTPIDLGELRADQPPQPAGGWPLWERLRRQSPHWTQLAAAVLVAALTLTLFASAGPARDRLTLVFQHDGVHDYIVDDQHLYFITEDSSRQPQEVVAYRLSDGALQWHSPLPPNSSNVTPSIQGGVLVLSGESTSGPQIRGFDRHTGEPLWTVDGWRTGVIGQGEDQLLILHSFDTGLTAIRPDTGAEVWRFAEEFDTRTLFDTHYLVRIGSNADPDEHLVQVYDPAAGELITTGLLPVVRSVESQLIGSLLLFVHRTDGAVQVSGYDVTTLTHQWTQSLPRPPSQSILNLHACGALICLAHDHVLYVLDPSTGDFRWTFAPSEHSPDQDQPIRVEPLPDPAQVDLLVVSISVDQSPQSWLVDASSGEPVLDLADWTLYPPSEEEEQSVVAIRYFRSVPVWVGRLADDRSRIDVLGELPLPPITEFTEGYCISEWPYLACRHRTRPGESPALTVWQVRTGAGLP